METLIIPFNALASQIRTEKDSRSGWFENYTEIANKDVSVLMLCILYHNNIITKKSFTARMKQYYETVPNNFGNQVPKLERRLGTYKSEVLDKWYSDIPLTNVFVEEVMETCNTKDLSVEDYLKYLNLGLNKNKNYCVDFIAFNVFSVIIEHHNRGWAYKFLGSCMFNTKDLNLSYVSFEEADRRYDLSFGYCCGDCDGSLKSYKQNRYEYHYKKDSVKELKDYFVKVFRSMKTHNKNPHDKLLLF